MKKRILCLALVFVMVFSLMPFSAFAIGGTTITSQPQSQTCRIGETVIFSVEAVNANVSQSTLRYIWYDSDIVNFENYETDITNWVKTDLVTPFKQIFEPGKLGEGKTLTLTNVQSSMNVKCVVYWVESRTVSLLGLSRQITVPADIVTSSVATLTVNTIPVCAVHSTTTNLRCVSAVEPTCAHEGNYTYYVCNTCGQCYKDANGLVSTTPDAEKLAKLSVHQIEYVEATPGNCHDRSIEAHYECKVCGQVYKDEAGTQPTSIVQLQINGKKDPDNHVGVEYYPEEAATCDEKGHVEYWFCDGCNTYFSNEELTASYKDDDATEIEKNPANHANGLKEVPATAATCERKGNVQYWYCDDCHEYFGNSEGTQKYKDKSDAEIPALGHNYSWKNVDETYHAQVCSNCGVELKSKHEVGTHANCQEPATCRICGLQYGDVNPAVHANTELRNVKEATIASEGYSGDVYCADCKAFISAGQTVPKLCKHTDPNSKVVVHHDAVEATCSECHDQHEGNVEYWECTECGKVWKDEALTQEITLASTVIPLQKHYIVSSITNDKVVVWKHDSALHWKECKYCETQLSAPAQHNLKSSIPTCVTGHVCAACGYDDGKIDPNNHVNLSEPEGVREPTAWRTGYTGDIKCLDCGKVVVEGREYKIPCENGCAGHLEYIPAVEPDCYNDGVKEHYKCKKCWNLYLDENATVKATAENLVKPCEGHDLHPDKESLTIEGLKKMLKASNWSGLVSGKESLKDAIVGWLNGDPSISIGNQISTDDIFASIKMSDIDHCSDDTHHWLGCQRCGKTLKDLQKELEEEGYFLQSDFFDIGQKEEHAGGTATCNKKAVCAECGAEYGGYAEHHYNEYNYCTGCGIKVEPCEAPTVKTSNVSTSGKIKLTWNAVEGADYYQVYRATSKNGEFSKYYTTKAGATSYTNTSATAGRTYYYQVRAMGVNGSTGVFSDVVSRTCDCAAPVVTATNSSSSGKVVLSWAAVKGATKYEIWRATSENGSYTNLTTTSSTSYTNTSSKPGVTYYYKVKAISADTSYANSAYSDVVSCIGKCARPVVTTSNVASSGKIKLTWEPVTGAEKYEIYRATSKSGTYTKMYTTTKTSYTNTGAVAGTTYYYKVKAIASSTSSANSAYSSVVSRTCDCARPTVKIALKSGDPRLTWSAVDGADEYVVYRATSKNGTYTKMLTTSYKSYTNTSAKAGTTYYYKVKAISADTSYANSAYSSIVSIRAK